MPIAVKNYHITASNGLARCASTASFIAVKYDFIGIVQEGQNDVTTRKFLGLIWVWDSHPFHMCTRPWVSSCFPLSWPQDTTPGYQRYSPESLNRALKYFELKGSDAVRHVTQGPRESCACSLRKSVKKNWQSEYF